MALASLFPLKYRFTDLPTCKTWRSWDFEKKSPEKPGDLGPQTWRFPKKIKRAYLLFQGIIYLIYAHYCLLLLLFLKEEFLFPNYRSASKPPFWVRFTAKALQETLAHLYFTGMRLELYAGFPQTLDVTNLAISNTYFLIASYGKLNCLTINFKILDSPWDFESNRETVS